MSSNTASAASASFFLTPSPLSLDIAWRDYDVQSDINDVKQAVPDRFSAGGFD
jgi:hypothetical protein